jgi:hypothetical protein
VVLEIEKKLNHQPETHQFFTSFFMKITGSFSKIQIIED